MRYEFIIRYNKNCDKKWRVLMDEKQPFISTLTVVGNVHQDVTAQILTNQTRKKPNPTF